MKLKLFFSIIVCMILFSFVVPLMAQSFMFEPENSDMVKLVIGEVTIFNVVSPQRVSIRNPDIADISKVTDNEVVVVARLGGDTVLTIWDKQGQRSYNISVLPRDLEIVQDKLKELINKNLRVPGVYFRKNEVTGKIMVLGKVSPVQKDHIERILETFKDSVDNLLTLKDETKMVEIDCQILEMNRKDVEEMGIKWQEFLQLREEPYGASASDNSVAVNTSLDRVAPWAKLWPVRLWSRDALTARIDMLISSGKGRILSRPKLLCLSGKEARLVVGGEVPYVSASSTNTVGTQVEVEYRDYGVILELKPIINDDGQIILDISTEVSELDMVSGITISSITLPAFIKREAKTVLSVISGDTIFIGGLIQNSQAKTIDKIPALGNIPILGALFRSKSFQQDETELIITLTPRLIESKKKAEVEHFSQGPKETLPRKMSITPEYLQQDDLLNEYILRVQRMVAQSLHYPRLAQEAGWQGAVTLRVRISNDGEILDVKISQPSGYVSFDNNVLATAKSLSPYPPFPPSIDVEDLWIDIPIVYQMN